MIPADVKGKDATAAPTTEPRHFTRDFFVALTAGLIAATILSPFAAWGLAAAGFRFPFPRVFDRTVMGTLTIALIVCARRFKPWALLRSGFAQPAAHLGQFAIGLVVALSVIAALFAIATAIGCGSLTPPAPILARAARFAAAALLIAIIEEGFFRALLLAGIKSDYGPRTALLGSAAFYSITHILRSPAHFYLTGFQPLAGLEDLGLSASRLVHPSAGTPALIGLFLLGTVLGEAFMLSGTVYFSIGLHAGFVIGAKTWPAVVDHAASVPGWLAGPGPVPLIAAPAAWVAAAAIAFTIPLLLRRQPDPR
ncbi:MAG: CPBP family glutamic-type intramembrane protease [Candidatus Binataceae bacterium]